MLGFQRRQREILRHIGASYESLYKLLHRQTETIMAKLDDITEALNLLADSVAGLTTTVSDSVGEIEVLLAKIGSGDSTPEQVATLVEQCKQITSTIKAQTDALNTEVAKAKDAAP